MIQGLTLLDSNPVSGGGFADIYKAQYKDREVALKRTRIFLRNPGAEQIHRVCITSYMP